MKQQHGAYLLKRKNMSLAAFLYIYAPGLVRPGFWEEGQAQEFSISPAAGESRTTTLMQGLGGGFYRGKLCQLNQYRGRFHTYCGNLQTCVGWGRQSHRINYENPTSQSFLSWIFFFFFFGHTGIFLKL